ncbi:unnamed protein product [Mycena citricolor]|uniref:Uncharacterized protein n=1 Tax=Mycena citricolor TaxID=2018698 RepID=A0AAD2JUZ7_9AGAR|nr:unnamed protein product [Mycena citricolor]
MGQPMFRTPSQLPLGLTYARPIVVEEYTFGDYTESELDLILRARSAAGHIVSWRTPSNTSRALRIANNCYELSYPPPMVSSERNHASRALPDWDTDVQMDELFCIDELEPFENTDLLQAMIAPSQKRSNSPLIEPFDAKRRKLDVSSLRNCIPRPHMYPSTHTALTTSRYSTYIKSEPIAIPPYALPLPAPLPYTRRSWLIPIRGEPPWLHASTAVVLRDPPEAIYDQERNQLHWTIASVQAFWDFLKANRNRKSFGGYGLSFHITQIYGGDYTQTRSQSASWLGGFGQPVSASDRDEDPDDEDRDASMHQGLVKHATALTAMDHIKIYHDAQFSMEIRSLLHTWAFACSEAEKIPLLEGSKLTLLDERMNGILIL